MAAEILANTRKKFTICCFSIKPKLVHLLVYSRSLLSVSFTRRCLNRTKRDSMSFDFLVYVRICSCRLASLNLTLLLQGFHTIDLNRDLLWASIKISWKLSRLPINFCFKSDTELGKWFCLFSCSFSSLHASRCFSSTQKLSAIIDFLELE